jgi:hypothetical protein
LSYSTRFKRRATTRPGWMLEFPGALAAAPGGGPPGSPGEPEPALPNGMPPPVGLIVPSQDAKIIGNSHQQWNARSAISSAWWPPGPDLWSGYFLKIRT